MDVVSLGMLAIRVMAGPTAYALSEARGKREGLDLKPREGLVFAAVFDGVAAVPLIWTIDRVAADPRTMGDARSGWLVVARS